MRERDCKAPRLANRFDAIEAHDTQAFRAGCAWYFEKIGFVKGRNRGLMRGVL